MMTSGAGRLLVSVHEILEPKMAYSRPRVEEAGRNMKGASLLCRGPVRVEDACQEDFELFV